MTKPMYVSTGFAAKYLGVSDTSLRHWAKEGRIAYVITPGGHFRYFLPDVANLVLKNGKKEKENDSNARLS